MEGMVAPFSLPSAPAKDLRHLMGIAVVLEREAARRYLSLATAVEAHGGGDELSLLFRELAQMETGHERELLTRAASVGFDADIPVPDDPPETFDEDGSRAGVELMTPYHALAIAIRNEERAFAFYSYFSAIATDDEVKTTAAGLAREELGHVARLRAFRRRVYQKDRPQGLSDRVAEATSPAGLETVFAGLATGSAGLCRGVMATLEQSGDHAGALLVSQAVSMVERWERPDSRLAPTATVSSARAAGLLELGSLTRLGAIKLAVRDAEETVEVLLAVADSVNNDRVVARAQTLAEQTLTRLTVLRAPLNDPSLGRPLGRPS